MDIILSADFEIRDRNLLDKAGAQHGKSQQDGEENEAAVFKPLAPVYFNLIQGVICNDV